MCKQHIYFTDRDMAARHRARGSSIQIMKVDVIPANKCRRPHVKQMHVSFLHGHGKGILGRNKVMRAKCQVHPLQGGGGGRGWELGRKLAGSQRLQEAGETGKTSPTLLNVLQLLTAKRQEPAKMGWKPG